MASSLRESRAEALGALILPSGAPVALIAWVVVTVLGAPSVNVWGWILPMVSFGAIWAARTPVDKFRKSDSKGSGSRVPDGLLQFTSGYFRYHAKIARVQAAPFAILCWSLMGLVLVGWAGLIVASATSLMLSDQ